MQGLHQRLERQFKAASTERSTHETLGMMTALASTPTPVRAMGWLKDLLAVSEFDDQAGAEVFVGEVLHVYNEIVTKLQEDEAVGPASEDEDVVREWCEGYVDVATVDPEWASDERGKMILVPFMVLAGTFDPSELPDETGVAEQWRRELPDIVRLVYHYWDDAREANGIRLADDNSHDKGWDSTYRREQPKVGRNELCVCGSGKKYKRCCGLQ